MRRLAPLERVQTNALEDLGSDPMSEALLHALARIA
jgi:hypothetical protein